MSCAARGKGISAEVGYAAVGFGSHLWVATSVGSRWFVTVDDLTRTPFLGHPPARPRMAVTGSSLAVVHGNKISPWKR
jgi:hypothetical protein